MLTNITDSAAALNLPDRIINAAERRRLVPYTDVHIWRLEKARKFPKRIRLGANRVGWSLNEVIDWVEARKAEREACPLLTKPEGGE